MGLDGGTIISRNDVLRRSSALVNAEDSTRSTRGGAVRGVFKRRRLEPTQERRVRWSTCALSGERLAAPVVADWLGTLYNRQAVLEFLLAKQGNFGEEGGLHRLINQLREAGDALEHLTSMRDVFAVTLCPDPEEDADAASSTAPHRCPVTDLPCTTGAFCALAPCGHVVSERALKELRGADGGVSCPSCAAAAPAEAVVPILGTDEQVAALRELLPTRRKHKRRREREEEKQAQA